MHDGVLACPVEQAAELAQNRRDAWSRERLARRQLLCERRIGDSPSDYRKGVVTEPASFDHRNEATVRDTREGFRVGCEVRERVALVPFRSGIGRDDDARLVVAALGFRRLCIGDVDSRAVVRPFELADDLVVGFEQGKVDVWLGLAHEGSGTIAWKRVPPTYMRE